MKNTGCSVGPVTDHLLLDIYTGHLYIPWASKYEYVPGTYVLLAPSVPEYKSDLDFPDISPVCIICSKKGLVVTV